MSVKVKFLTLTLTVHGIYSPGQIIQVPIAEAHVLSWLGLAIILSEAHVTNAHNSPYGLPHNER